MIHRAGYTSVNDGLSDGSKTDLSRNDERFEVKFTGKTGLNLHPTVTGRGAFVKSLWATGAYCSSVAEFDVLVKVGGESVEEIEFGLLCQRLLTAPRPVCVVFERRIKCPTYLSLQELKFLLSDESNELVSAQDRGILRSFVLTRGAGMRTTITESDLENQKVERMLKVAKAFFGSAGTVGLDEEGSSDFVTTLIPQLSILLQKTETLGALYLFAVTQRQKQCTPVPPDTDERLTSFKAGATLLGSLSQAASTFFPLFSSSESSPSDAPVILVSPSSVTPETETETDTASPAPTANDFLIYYPDFCCQNINPSSMLLYPPTGFSVHYGAPPPLNPSPRSLRSASSIDCASLDSAAQLLSARQMAVLTCALLLERRIVLVYSSTQQKSAVWAMMSVLLFTLKEAKLPWLHPADPDCPSVAMLDSPFPFLIGMNRKIVPAHVGCESSGNSDRDLLVLDVESASFAFPLPLVVEQSLSIFRSFVAASDPVLRPRLFLPLSARAEQSLAFTAAERMSMALRLLRQEIQRLLDVATSNGVAVFDSRIAKQPIAALCVDLPDPCDAGAGAGAGVGASADTAVLVVLDEAAILRDKPPAMRSFLTELFRTQHFSSYLTS